MPAKSKSSTATGFAQLLQERAVQQAEQVAFTFLDHQIEKAQTLTYAQLYQGALRAAAALAECAGKPALLLYPPGPDLITALFGCFLSGAIAVPARPPHPNRLHKADPRLAAVAIDARAAMVLTTEEIAAAERRGRSPERPLYGLTKRVIDPNAPADGPALPRPAAADQPALIQYTSGSTAGPRGVVINHGTLLTAQKHIAAWLGTTRADRFLSWLPPYHDMGLIGAILHPVYLGARCWLMDAAHFAAHPASWPAAVSRYHATVSGAPDFAYALAARRTPRAERLKLDLHRWRIAFNGAQPVRHATLELFAESFAEAGFRKEALCPCYGLAEATLFVSGAEPAEEPRYMALDPEALARHHVAPPEDEDRAVLAASCGKPAVAVQIVHPATGKGCEEGRIGEIWLQGPTTRNSYHHRPGLTQAVFEAGPDPKAPWLRTGDLGFLKDGHLFITGREKELIIIRGRNHYPQDLEWTAETALGALIGGQGSAFTREPDGEEQLILVWELHPRELDRANVYADQIRAAIAAEHGIQTQEILFISPNTLPRTTSGKIKRRMCRALYEEGRLDPIFRHALPAPNPGARAGRDLVRTLAAVPTDGHRLHLLTDFLLQTAGRALQLSPEAIQTDTSLVRMGLDSMAALEISCTIEEELHCLLPSPKLLAGLTLTQTAAAVMASWQEARPTTGPEPRTAALGRHPLSYAQRNIWKHSSTRGVHNIAFAAGLPESVDREVLTAALRYIQQRHAMLRTTIGIHDGEPFQQVHAELPLHLEDVDARAWSPEELREHLADEAHHPLGEGPFWRVLLFHRKHMGPVMLWVADPVALDLWSLALLVHEFGVAYREYAAGRSPHLDPPALDFTDVVYWQESVLTGPEGRLTWQFWQRLLHPAPPPLALPTDLPRNHLPTRRAAVFDFRLDAGLVWELELFARDRHTTLCTVLMAAWTFLLQRYSGEDDLVVGTMCTGRERAPLHHMVGPLTNLLPLRMDLSGNPRFSDFTDKLHQLMLQAQTFQDFPYALMCERLADLAHTDPAELCRVLFLYQGRPPLGDAGLSGFALGGQTSSLNLQGLELASIHFEQRTTTHELTLTVVETRQGGDFSASLEYRADLFHEATIARMAHHYLNLLQALMDDPSLHVDAWHLLARAERERLVLQDSRRIRRRRTCLHQLFQKQVARASEHMLVVHGDRTWDYARLNAEANRLAHFLMQHGIGREEPVGLCCERGLEMTAAVLGILKAGAVLVPLVPGSDVTSQAGAAGCRHILCTGHLAHLFPADQPLLLLDLRAPAIAAQPTNNPDVPVSPANLANVRYQPEPHGRWIHISHANLIQLPSAIAAHMEMQNHSERKPVWCAASQLSDAGGVAELLLPLALGLKLVVVDPVPLATEVDQRDLQMRHKPMAFSLVWDGLPKEDRGGADTFLPALCKAADAGAYSALWLVGNGNDPSRVNPLIWATQAAISSQRVRLRYVDVAGEGHQATSDWSLIATLSKGRLDMDVPAHTHEDPAHQATPAPRALPATNLAACRDAGTAGADLVVRACAEPLLDLAAWIEAYRAARTAADHAGTGTVTFMVPVYLTSDDGELPEALRPAYRRRLQTFGYDRNAARALARDILADPHATQALFGSAGRVARQVDLLKAMGVDELACEPAFGLPADMVTATLPQLAFLQSRVGAERHGPCDADLRDHLTRYRVTHMHCAASGLSALMAMPGPPEGLRHVLISGPEPDAAMRRSLTHLAPVTFSYLHGQGETTTSALIRRLGQGSGALGDPLAHTHTYVVDGRLQPTGPRKPGELAVGGDGVCRGYGGRPALTAVRFVPDPFGDEVGGRLFLTGLQVRRLEDGSLEPVSTEVGSPTADE